MRPFCPSIVKSGRARTVPTALCSGAANTSDGLRALARVDASGSLVASARGKGAVLDMRSRDLSGILDAASFFGGLPAGGEGIRDCIVDTLFLCHLCDSGSSTSAAVSTSFHRLMLELDVAVQM